MKTEAMECSYMLCRGQRRVAQQLYHVMRSVDITKHNAQNCHQAFLQYTARFSRSRHSYTSMLGLSTACSSLLHLLSSCSTLFSSKEKGSRRRLSSPSKPSCIDLHGVIWLIGSLTLQPCAGLSKNEKESHESN